MCQRTIFSRSCSRIAEEVQLKAEEEFLVEALKMIRQQRNCLQIERLHLESLRQQLLNPSARKNNNEQDPQAQQEQSKETTNPPQSKPTELMSAVDMMNLGSMQHKDDLVNIADDMECNNQELNLNLNPSGSGFGTARPLYTDYYNSDDGSDSDASEADNVMIDINMLMNGNTERD